MLVNPHFFFILPFFPYLQFTAGEFENFTAGEFENFTGRLFSPVLILANINLFGGLVFVGFLLVVCS